MKLIRFLLLSMIQLGSLYCRASILCDINGYPVLSLHSIDKISYNEKWYLPSDSMELDLGLQPYDVISYQFGPDSLCNYLSSLCRAEIDLKSEEYCTKSYRQHVLYALLLDKKLDVVDIRIIRCYDFNALESIMPIIHNAFLSVKGHWIVKYGYYDYYAFIGEFWL